MSPTATRSQTDRRNPRRVHFEVEACRGRILPTRSSTPEALALLVRASEGVLRRIRNLCIGSLSEAVRDRVRPSTSSASGLRCRNLLRGYDAIGHVSGGDHAAVRVATLRARRARTTMRARPERRDSYDVSLEIGYDVKSAVNT